MNRDDEAVRESNRLGLGLPAGDPHYRAYVGPPEDYDLIAAMSFNLLTTLGLRQHHRLLDVGCGSLRLGRLLIPYLNVGNYTGIEPAKWLVEEGIAKETGGELVELKKARFVFADSPEALEDEKPFDFAIGQSIFSHAARAQVDRWLRGVSASLVPSGAFVATFLIGEADYKGSDWCYPQCVEYTVETMQHLSEGAGLSMTLLDWRHPRQTWALFARPEFDLSWFKKNTLSWNLAMDVGPLRGA